MYFITNQFPFANKNITNCKIKLFYFFIKSFVIYSTPYREMKIRENKEM